VRNVAVFTSAAANYLPKARALFNSLRRQRPEWRLYLALADEAEPEIVRRACGADEVLELASLGIPRLRPWTFSHSLVELATAIKPMVFRRLLSAGADAVIYLDPDVVVFSPLDEVAAALADHEVLLTPHQTAPETAPADVIQHEICTLQHGIYNLGFLAVANRGDGPAFVEWWARRTYHFCHEAVTTGLYTDQRWIDLAPALFDGVKILRTPALNVAPWNLSRRRLAGRLPDGLTVDGSPLGFFHFSAIDSGGLAGFRADPAAAALEAWYAEQTKPRAGDPAAPWRYSRFDDGEAIQPEQRLVYRLRGDLQGAFPEPFAAGPGSYQAWWRAQAPLEFPALFDPGAREAEFDRLRSALTTGYADEFAPTDPTEPSVR
jgi:hypothetical protein